MSFSHDTAQTYLAELIDRHNNRFVPCFMRLTRSNELSHYCQMRDNRRLPFIVGSIPMPRITNKRTGRSRPRSTPYVDRRSSRLLSPHSCAFREHPLISKIPSYRRPRRITPILLLQHQTTRIVVYRACRSASSLTFNGTASHRNPCTTYLAY